jgi:hypothetical protein
MTETVSSLKERAESAEARHLELEARLAELESGEDDGLESEPVEEPPEVPQEAPKRTKPFWAKVLLGG